MSNLTARQVKILKIIVEKYNELFEPIGSKLVANVLNNTISSQTIRNEMATLEKLNYLNKAHISSGRIPTKLALEFYSNNLIEIRVEEKILNKLEALFVKREKNIDDVISDSLAMLNEITSLPSLSNVYYSNETLREINLIQLNDENALLMVVTNLANVYKNYIVINNQSKFNDAKVCIRLLNEKLVGTELINLKEKIQEIIPIIKNEVKEYEFITKEIISKLFNATLKNSNKTNVVGMTSLSQYPEFQDPKVLFNIIEMIESGSIWQQIKYNLDKDNHVKIEYQESNSLNDDSQILAIATTEIEYNNTKRQISIIGPSRIEIGKIKGILNYLKSQIEEMFKK